MARKEITKVEGVEGVETVIFSLNESIVGRGGHNYKRSDIQLVQFFLRQFYKGHPELFAKLPKTKSGGNLIKIDGDVGRQTETAILLFQKYIFEKGRPIKVDGLVNIPVDTYSPISKTMYTIMHLNNWFRSYGEGKEYLNNLENHPEIKAYAPELQAELAVSEIGDRF